MLSTRIAQAVTHPSSPVRRVAINLNRNGDCTIGCSPAFETEMDAGTLLSHNKLFVNVLDTVRSYCTSQKSLDIANIKYRDVMRNLADLGLSAYQALGAHFQWSWQEHVGIDASVHLAVVTSRFPLLWECLYQGAYGSSSPDGFWGLRHNVVRGTIGATTHSDLHLHDLSDLLFCHHDRLPSAKKELEGIQSFLDQRLTITVFDDVKGAPNIEGPDLFIQRLHDFPWDICHLAAHSKLSPSSNSMESYLEMTQANNPFKVYLYQLNAASARGFAKHKPPIVFLNACKTASNLEILLEGMSFPRAFVKWGASAVIATACEIPDFFAEAFAGKFYEFLVDSPAGKPVALSDCLSRTRRYFIEEHQNPLGLAYLLYAYGDVFIDW